MATLDDLFAVLQHKAGLEVVNHTLTAPSRLRVLGRLPMDRAGTNINNWKVLMDRLLTATERGRPWSVDLSKSYFKKAGKVVYAWRLIFQADEVEKQYADIINIIRTSPQAARQVPDEVRLYGVEQDRNNPAGGKRGAGMTDKTAVGAAAAMRKSMGG